MWTIKVLPVPLCPTYNIGKNQSMFSFPCLGFPSLVFMCSETADKLAFCVEKSQMSYLSVLGNRRRAILLWRVSCYWSVPVRCNSFFLDPSADVQAAAHLDPVQHFLTVQTEPAGPTDPVHWPQLAGDRHIQPAASHQTIQDSHQSSQVPSGKDFF